MVKAPLFIVRVRVRVHCYSHEHFISGNSQHMKLIYCMNQFLQFNHGTSFDIMWTQYQSMKISLSNDKINL